MQKKGTNVRVAAERGFTLIELMTVVLIIGILVGILLPALRGTKRQAMKKRATENAMTLTTAITMYKYDRGDWPCPDPDLDGTTDRTYTVDNNVIIDKLKSAVPPLINMGSFQTNSVGCVVDPWGAPYSITIDIDRTGPSDDMPNGVRVWSTSTNNMW